MKILIIRFSSIGDIVLTTPVLRCIKQQLPESEIFYLTKSAYSGLLSSNPYIDKLFLLNDSLTQVIKDLKKEQIDLIIDLHHNLRTFLVKSSLQIPSVSFNKLNLEKWMFVHLKKGKLPDLHIVDRYLQTVEMLGVRNDLQGLDFFIPGEFEMQKVFSIPENYIVFCIGGKFVTKKMPLQKIIEIAEKINRYIVLVGGNEDFNAGEEIRQACGSKVTNLCGKTNFLESAFIIRDAEKVITHDTGMMHIAAALHKEIISVWGNTVPAFGMYPYFGSKVLEIQKSHIVEVKNLKCRPCSKLGYKKCPEGHFKCMNQIDPEEIFRWI